MKKPFSKLIMLFYLCLVLGLPQMAMSANENVTMPLKAKNVEVTGAKKATYLVKDINDLTKPYNYVIGKSTFLIIEIVGILAIVGALIFGFGHGFGRFMATKKTPIELEAHGSEYVYNVVMRIGHWINAAFIVTLIFTGFVMHYMGPTHAMGKIHNFIGNALVGLYILFIVYELVTKDYKQFITKKWEIKEGIFKQGLFYAIGIFKREEHPYHMSKDSRLNPLQKPAYFGVMFLVLPVVIITGFLMANPVTSAPVLNYIGLENMNVIFILHLIAGFFMFAFLLGHIYLATTGDTLLQHFEVMITGKHKHYKYKKAEQKE